MDAVFHWANCGSLESCQPVGSSAATRVQRQAFVAKSDYAKQPLIATPLRTIVEAVEARQNDRDLGAGGIALDSYGGAINRIDKQNTAFVHRDALFSMQYLAFWERTDRARIVNANRSWIRGFHRAMRPHVSGAAYQNYGTLLQSQEGRYPGLVGADRVQPA